MIRRLKRKASIFVRNLVELDNIALGLPNSINKTLSVLTAMLNFSYLQNNKQNHIFYICQLLARPHIYMRQQILGYLIVFLNIYYIVSIFFHLPYRKLISLYGQLIRTSLLNLILEVSNFPICYINQSIGIIISGLQHFYCQRNIDIIIKNTFSSIKLGFLNHIIWILSIVQSLSWYYNINSNGLYTITIIHTLFSWKATNSSIDSSIYCFTFLMTIFDLSQFVYDISSILVIYPLILKFSFLLKGDKHIEFLDSLSKPETQLIQVSKFIENKMYIKGLNQLNEIKSEGILFQIRKQMFKERCLIKIQEIIDANSNPQQSLIDSLSKKIEMEEKYYRIITDFQKFLNQKIRLLSLTNFEKFELFYEFLEQILKYHEKLNKVAAPTNQYKSLQLFFNAEISHDLHELQLLQNSKEVVTHSSYEVEKMAYIITVYDKGLKVLSASKNPLINNQECIDSYIPPGIREWHTQLVDQFLTTGKSKYLQRLDMNLMVQKNEKVMTYIDFGFTTCITNELKFITYMEVSPEQLMTMILNQQLQITCLSEKLFSSFNMGSYNYYGQYIKKFIPYFSATETYQENIEVYISDSDQEIPLITSIRTTIKYLDDQPIYYLLYFDYVRKSSQRIKSASQFTQQQSYLGISEGGGIIPDNRAKSDFDINFQFNIADEENLQVPYYEDDGNFQSLNYVQQLDDNTNIYSPGNNQSRQKLIRRDTFASKFQKLSLNQGQQENVIEFPQVNSKFKLRKDYVFEFYEQHYPVTKKFKLTLTLSLLIVLIFYLLQAAKVNADLTTLVNDIDVLNFGQITFQPLESNLLIAFSLSEYALFYVYQYITFTQYKYFVTFPAETFPKGFERIQKNLNSLFQQASLTHILDDNSLEIYQYTNASIPESYNVSLRNAFGMLLSFQYDGLMDVIKNKKLNADSAYAYFTFKNYLPLKLIVTDLNSILLQQTILIAENGNNLLTILLIIEIFVYSGPYLLSFYYFILITKQISRYYNILLQLTYEQKQLEISKYKQQLHSIAQDYECLLNYKFSIHRFIQKDRINRLKLHNQLKYRGSFWKLAYLFLYLFILLKSILLYYYTQNYMSEYEDIAHFYRSLSDLSIDITSIYSAREVLYFRTSFTYLDSQTIAQLLVQIEESLNRTIYFQQHEFIKEKTILSDQFQNYYESVTEGDLCSQLPKDLQNSTSLFCSQLFSGNMKSGLLACLNIMINNVRTEFNLNQFKQKLSIELYDMEGPYLLSQIVDLLYQELRQDLLNYTNDLLYIMNIINISTISLLGLLILLSKFIIFNRIDRLLCVSKRFVIFLPIETFFQEATERFIRNLMYKSYQ